MLDWISALFDGSLLAGGVFLIIGIVGGVLLLFSLLLDGVFDFFDFGDGPLSLTSIAAFTTIFGFSSFGFIGLGLSSPVAGLLGAGAGVLGGAVAWWIARVMRDSESNTSVSMNTLIGATAVVTLAVPEGGGFGEIALTRHGERVSLSASAREPLERGARVEITDALSATSVLVQRASITETMTTVTSNEEDKGK